MYEGKPVVDSTTYTALRLHGHGDDDHYSAAPEMVHEPQAG